MNKADNDLVEYHTARIFNREVFLLNYSFAFHAFTQIDQNFLLLADVVRSRRDKSGHGHVSFVPFFLLMQRQARSAFEALTFHQSYEAWVLLRVCIESALIMGKWVDDPEYARVWRERLERPKEYRRAYAGTALQSRSLPRSVSIQTVLARINDDFIHANPTYYHRHVDARPMDDQHFGLLLSYFDQKADVEAHIYAILHLIVVIQDSVLSMLRALFPDIDELSVGLRNFEKEFSERVQEFIQRQPDHKTTLVDLGLWGEIIAA